MNNIEIPKSKMTLYTTDIASQLFLDSNELKNLFKKKFFAGKEKRIFSKNIVFPISYIGDFAEKSDVVLTIKDGNSIFYTVESVEDSLFQIKVLEGRFVDGKVIWCISKLDSLSTLYEKFRNGGVVFKNDLYAKKEIEYQRELEIIYRQIEALEEREKQQTIESKISKRKINLYF